MVSTQPRSHVVTCLTRPPMQMALVVGLRRICSSVRPYAALRMPARCCSRYLIRPSRSSATGGTVPGMSRTLAENVDTQPGYEGTWLPEQLGAAVGALEVQLRVVLPRDRDASVHLHRLGGDGEQCL